MSTIITPKTDHFSTSTSISTPNAETSGTKTPTFEGGSSLSAHSVYASEFLTKAVDNHRLSEPSSEMAAALSSLRSIVSRQSLQAEPPPAPHFSFQRFQAHDQLDLIPMQVVINILRQVKGRNPRKAGVLFLLIVCRKNRRILQCHSPILHIW